MRLHLALALISVVAAVPQPVLDALEVRAADPTIDVSLIWPTPLLTIVDLCPRRAIPH